MNFNTIQSLQEAYQQVVEAGINPFETDAFKKAKTKAAVDFFTKPIKPLPPYEARKPRFPALTLPDFDLGSNKKERPITPPIKRDDGKTEKPKPPVSEKPKPPVTSAPPNPKPPATPAPPKAETPKTETPKPTQPPTTTTPTPAPAPAPKGGEVAMSKLGDKSDYSAAATAKMSDRTKNILGTKDSVTGQTIRKPADFRSPREKALNQSFDLFDVVLGHLLDEGYADTNKAALAIMANMSEEWRQSIVEGVRPGDVETPLNKKKYKERRRSLAGREERDDARSRGHEEPSTGRTYSTGEARSRRRGIHTPAGKPNRDAARDAAGGETGHGGPLRPNKVRKARAMGELGEK